MEAGEARPVSDIFDSIVEGGGMEAGGFRNLLGVSQIFLAHPPKKSRAGAYEGWGH